MNWPLFTLFCKVWAVGLVLAVGCEALSDLGVIFYLAAVFHVVSAVCRGLYILWHPSLTGNRILTCCLFMYADMALHVTQANVLHSKRDAACTSACAPLAGHWARSPDFNCICTSQETP